MPAAPTYDNIATNTFGSGSNSVTFSSLGSYSDIRIICSVLGTSASQDIGIRFNSDTGSNYAYASLYGAGGGITSSRSTNQTYITFLYAVGNTTNTPSTTIIDIINYRNATVNKSVLARVSATGAIAINNVIGQWRNTSAITSITLTTLTGNFASGDTIALYGITRA